MEILEKIFKIANNSNNDLISINKLTNAIKNEKVKDIARKNKDEMANSALLLSVAKQNGLMNIEEVIICAMFYGIGYAVEFKGEKENAQIIN